MERGYSFDSLVRLVETTKTTDDTGELPNKAIWLADTSVSALSRAMPATPFDGEEVGVIDNANNASVNNITLTVVEPTTITAPVLNLDGQAKRWRYDATEDTWDLVFNNASILNSLGGGIVETFKLAAAGAVVFTKLDEPQISSVGAVVFTKRNVVPVSSVGAVVFVKDEG